MRSSTSHWGRCVSWRRSVRQPSRRFSWSCWTTTARRKKTLSDQRSRPNRIVLVWRQGPAGHVGDNLVASGEDQAVVRVPPKGGRHRMILGQLESVKPNRSAVQQGIDFTVEQIPCGCAVGGYEFLAAVHLAEVHSGG